MAGSWLQQQIVNAVTNGPNWNSTALFINYDEAGGYFDHVVPPMEPQSSWVTDKFNGNKTYVGFGPRVPMVVISPWTRGGNVFSETSDHTSTLMFLEEWIGKDSNGNYVAPAENVSPFHRSTSSNLYNIFDFNNPDYSVPKFDAVPKPAQVGGVWDPTEMCEILTDKKTTPPYGKQVVPIAESGSRPIRGAVTLGRTIAIQASTGEMISVASSGTNNKMTISAKKSSLKKRAASHSLSKEAAFTLIETGTKHEFKIQSVAHPSTCVNVWGNGIDLSECKGTSWKFDSSNGNHHLIDVGTSSYLNIKNGKVQLSKKKNAPFTIFSVTL